jgi:hypothetical protein
LKRLAALLLLFAAALPAQYVQAVEFPYYLYPRTLWERELVWMKTIGVSTVEFSIPWNWHQIEAGEFDFTGRTSPRRDLVAFVRLLRRLDLRAWVRPLPADARAQRAWLKALETVLATQTASHGGPIAYVEGRVLAIDAAAPPAPVAVISATDPSAFTRSRQALAGAARALLWTDVEDALYPAGWTANPESPLRKGAVGLSGDERPTTSALRRDTALLRNWARLLPGLHPVAMPKPAGITAAELVSPAASAVSITNTGTKPFHDDVRVREPESKRTLIIPGVSVPAGESLWLPLGVSIGSDGLCRECTNFSSAERIVYATAELLSIEFENGILAMEFAAPEPGEVVLQLARHPIGPFLAAGKPTAFDWDDKTLRARLTIPASSASGNRVRIGIAIEAPDTTAFFNDAKRLIIGRKNVVSTSYSSAEVAARSRLRLPEGFTAAPTVKSPDEIDYEISVPADALHGDWVNLALEADGMPLGRARLQLFRPATIRLMEAMQVHFGAQTELTPDPPTAPIEPKAGGNLEISIRNNWPQIRTYRLEATGEGMEFFPPKTEISVGAVDERRVSLRVFAAEGLAGVRDWRLRVGDLSGPGADADLPMRVVLLPRGRTVAWSADLDGDGSPEWVLESQKVRAIFSGQDGGRWMEFTWKDTNVNYLPEQGLFAGPGPVEVRASDDALEFTGKGWKRTARLSETTLTIEQSSPLPADRLSSEKRGGATLTIVRPSVTRVTYTLN